MLLLNRSLKNIPFLWRFATFEKRKIYVGEEEAEQTRDFFVPPKQQIKYEKQVKLQNKPKTIVKPNNVQNKFHDINLTPEEIQKIKEVNNYFKGIRMNTQYKKFYNEDSFDNIAKFNQTRKISDLPFRTQSDPVLGSASQAPEVQIVGEFSPMVSHIFKKIPQGQWKEKIRRLTFDFFKGLIQKKRIAKVQPNFQREAFRAIKSLGYFYLLKPSQTILAVDIKNVELFRGIQVIRNNNYSVDSYEIIKGEDYTFFKLWQKGAYRIPQPQWMSQRKMLLRITAVVESPIKPQVKQDKKPIQKHRIVFEMDLKLPPKFSQFQLSYKQQQQQIYTQCENVFSQYRQLNYYKHRSKKPICSFYFRELSEKKKTDQQACLIYIENSITFSQLIIHYLLRLNPLLEMKDRNNNQAQPIQIQVKNLASKIFKPPHTSVCSSHAVYHQNLDLVCLKSNCKQYLQLFCMSCSHNEQHLHSINHVVSTISKLIIDSWEEIRKQNSQIEHQWRTCQYNIKYCIDLFTEIHKLIQQSKSTRLYELPLFQGLLREVDELYRDGISIEQVAKKLGVLDSKYGVFDMEGRDKNKFNLRCIQQDKDFRLKKWMKSGLETKKFSESALAFSQRLSEQIEDRIKVEKRKKHLDEITYKKIVNLNQLLEQLNRSKKKEEILEKIEEVPTLSIELNEKRQRNIILGQGESNQQQFLTNNLSKFKNLSSITIKNKNGKITPPIWDKMISNFEFLKKLRELRLTLRYEDLLLLTKLFKSRPHAVRHIPILYLTITDQPKLDMKEVANFCNTLQLRQCYLVLSRDNISKSNFNEFMNTFRYKTSLSHLPMQALDINLTKNRITDGNDVRESTNRFKQRYGEIKKNNISI